MLLSFVVPSGRCHSLLAFQTRSVARKFGSCVSPNRLLAALALAAACCLGFLLPARTVEPVLGSPQVLQGHVPKITKQLTPVRRLAGTAHLDLAIGLPLRNRGQLTSLLH